MKPKPEALIVAALVFLAVILGVISCGKEDPEKDMLKSELKTTQARLDEVKDSLSREQKRTQEEMAAVQRSLQAERERVNQEVRQLRIAQQQESQAKGAAEDDSVVAAVIAFSCVIAMFLLVGLLLRERRSRKALGMFLRWIQGRSNGKTVQ